LPAEGAEEAKPEGPAEAGPAEDVPMNENEAPVTADDLS